MTIPTPKQNHIPALDSDAEIARLKQQVTALSRRLGGTSKELQDTRKEAEELRRNADAYAQAAEGWQAEALKKEEAMQARIDTLQYTLSRIVELCDSGLAFYTLAEIDSEPGANGLQLVKNAAANALTLNLKTLVNRGHGGVKAANSRRT